MNEERWSKFLKLGGSVSSDRSHGHLGGAKAILLVPDDANPVLEVGAGNLDWTKQLVSRHHKVIALDNYLEVISFPEGYTMLKGDAHEIPLDDKLVGAVYCAHTFEHMLAPLIVLYEFNRVLKQDGTLVLLSPHEREGWHQEPTHINLLNPRQVEHLAKRAGFELVHKDEQAGEDSYILVFKKVKDVTI